jgi:hypothetical protein
VLRRNIDFFFMALLNAGLSSAYDRRLAIVGRMSGAVGIGPFRRKF